ncbi:MAG TPA: hypothetical protein VL527_11150 [Dongiaceae bacterium]|nr:hypothetical protein [Dongiaceae bacterium]
MAKLTALIALSEQSPVQKLLKPSGEQNDARHETTYQVSPGQ